MKLPTKATLTFDNGAKPIELPVLSGNLGPSVIDIRSLGKSGYFTYDPGFQATASCSSSITFIDGDKGLLYYRGYPIEQLAQHSDFIEVAYLLQYGELPTAEQKQHFDTTMRQHTMLHDQIKQMTDIFKLVQDVHSGDVITMDYLPSVGTEIAVNGVTYGTIAGGMFHRALLKIWLGSEPVQADLKAALLGGK